MTFEYGETNRINGFTLSVSVPPSAKPTYSFVLDWEKREEPKILSINDKQKKKIMKHSSSERTIKDDYSLSSAESISFSKSSTMKKKQKFGGKNTLLTDQQGHFKHSEFEQKREKHMEKEKQHSDTKNQIYDNLESYERSIDNDNLQYKYSTDMMRNFMIKLKVIIRHHLNNNKTTENVITDKVINSSTLIDALRFLLRNTSISLIGNDYGRLFLLPDGKRNDKVRELSYDKNRYKQLTEFCSSGSRCILLLDLTNTFLKQTI